MGLHKDVAEDNMHEPKGMAALTAGANDVGKVAVSDGNGASTPRKLSQADMDQAGFEYAEHNITGNATVIAMAAAADSTLADNADYVQIVGIWDTTPHGDSNVITQQTDSLTVQTTGVYETHVWLDAASSVNSTVVAFKFAANGAIALARRPKNFLRNASEFHNLSAHGFVALTAGDVITLHMASDTAADITIEDCVFSLVLMRRT